MTPSSPIKLNTQLLKEWVASILSVIKTDTLLQGMDFCNKSGEIYILPLKKSNAQDKSSKKVAVFNKYLLPKICSI